MLFLWGDIAWVGIAIVNTEMGNEPILKLLFYFKHKNTYDILVIKVHPLRGKEVVEQSHWRWLGSVWMTETPWSSQSSMLSHQGDNPQPWWQIIQNLISFQGDRAPSSQCSGDNKNYVD